MQCGKEAADFDEWRDCIKITAGSKDESKPIFRGHPRREGGRR